LRRNDKKYEQEGCSPPVVSKMKETQTGGGNAPPVVSRMKEIQTEGEIPSRLRVASKIKGTQTGRGLNPHRLRRKASRRSREGLNPPRFCVLTMVVSKRRERIDFVAHLWCPRFPLLVSLCCLWRQPIPQSSTIVVVVSHIALDRW
jgi:hypothetical protein